MLEGLRALMNDVPTWAQVTLALAGIFITSLVTLEVAQTETAPARRTATVAEYNFIVKQLRKQVDQQAAEIEKLQSSVEDLKAERRQWQTERMRYIQDRIELEEQVEELLRQNERLTRRVAELERKLNDGR